MKLSPLVCGIAAALLSSHIAPAALIPVVEYRMYDGYGGNGWYHDNGYTGTKVGGYLSGGKGQLTDGSKGNPIGGGYAAATPYIYWANFNPEIIFDLGQVYDVGHIRTYFLIHNSSATYLPDRVDIAFSNDGVTYGPTVSRVFAAEEKNPRGLYNVEIDYQLLPNDQSGRFVKLTYIRGVGHEWMAFDEVEFSGVVPEPAGLSLLVLPAVAAMRGRRR